MNTAGPGTSGAVPTVETFRELAAKHPREKLGNPEKTGCQIRASWKGPNLAGGCPKNGSWPKNPQFHIFPSRNAEVTVELRQEMDGSGKGFGIGFVVVKADDDRAPKETVTKPEMVFYTKPYKASARVKATLPTLMPRAGNMPYILIPSTYEPHQFCDFQISIETSDPGLKFGWLGDAQTVFQGSLAPSGGGGGGAGVPAGLGGFGGGSGGGSGGGQPDNEPVLTIEGKGLSANQERELKALVAKAKKWVDDNGRPFEDADFPASDASIKGKNAAAAAKLPSVPPSQWRRPGQLKEVVDQRLTPSLFKPRAEIEGVHKGGGDLDNAWFLSACNIVAGAKEAVERVFYYPEKPASSPPDAAQAAREGFAVVGFFVDDPASDDDWVFVLVDDRVPCDGEGRPLFARCKSPEVYWMMLVEKAFAKHVGGYGSMSGGTVKEGLELLSGREPTVYDLTSAEQLETLTDGASAGADVSSHAARTALLRQHLPLWSVLEESFKSFPPQVVGCVWKTKEAKKEGRFAPAAEDTQERKDMGILPDTPYCVLGTINYDGTRLMRLRQLLGADEWRGDWSDKSHKWTGNMRRILNYSDADDGVFWMQYEDFVANFTKVYTCRMANDIFTKMAVRSRWQDFSAGGAPSYVGWRFNHQWLVDCPKNTKITVTLSTEHPRKESGSGKHGVKTAIGFGVWRGNARTQDRLRRRLTPDERDYVTGIPPRLVRKLVKAISLEASRVPYVLVPYTAQPGKELPFKLVLISDDREDDGAADFKFDPVRPATDWKTTPIRHQWGGEEDGGPPGTAKFWDNPQFELTLTKSSRVFVFVDVIVNSDTRGQEGMQTEQYPSFGVDVYQGSGPFCKLHAKEPGKLVDRSDVVARDGVLLEKQLDLNGGQPYVIIPFMAKRLPSDGVAPAPQQFIVTVYSDNKHTFTLMGARPECPICERMEIVLAKLVEREREMDERIAALEAQRHLVEYRCRPCSEKRRDERRAADHA